jgi:acetate kinase
MRLMLDPEPRAVRWCQETAAGRRAGRGVRGALRGGAVESVSYRFRHGGDGLRVPVSRVTPAVMAAAQEAVRYSPEYNGLTVSLLRELQERWPKAEHLLLCDTAFFWDLPAAASSYAVPAELRRRGVRRYGGDGLLHEWAGLQAKELFGPTARRVISVRLGDRSNAAALAEGRPVDTTIGFTPVEGILSDTCCGDIDSSVVFELQSSGLTLSEINELLSERSGIRALAGRRCGFAELLCGAGAGLALARRILRYEVVKSVGGFAALLGGADAVVFSVDDPPASRRFIRDICRDLACLGLRLGAPGSEVKTAVLKYDLWRVMSCLSQAAAREV